MNFDAPHRRYNPLTQEWVLVSPHRARRPWLGQVEKVSSESLPAYDPDCYLCPGNTRAGGKRNSNYTSTFVFDNDYSALLPPSEVDSAPQPANALPSSPLFKAEQVYGHCRVVCFSPRHDLTLPELPQTEVEAVISTWIEQTADLGRYPWINYVQVFENKGAMMGCSNPHPHSQIWGTSVIPDEPAKEIRSQAQYLEQHCSCMLCAYLEEERRLKERIVAENEHFTALVPFWAIWPFEVLLLSRRHFASLTGLNPIEISSLADVLRQVTTCYDNLFEISFPYSMGFHQAPTDDQAYPALHFHAHYYPPLLRSATIRKFMVGFEMLGMPQRDLTPETAAERLREKCGSRYRNPKISHT